MKGTCQRVLQQCCSRFGVLSGQCLDLRMTVLQTSGVVAGPFTVSPSSHPTTPTRSTLRDVSSHEHACEDLREVSGALTRRRRRPAQLRLCASFHAPSRQLRTSQGVSRRNRKRRVNIWVSGHRWATCWRKAGQFLACSLTTRRIPPNVTGRLRSPFAAVPGVR